MHVRARSGMLYGSSDAISINMLSALFRAFLDICLLRRGPQDIPASAALLGFTLVLYSFGSLIIARSSLDWAPAMQAAVAETLLMCGLSYILLQVTGLAARWIQTATAIAGTNFVLVIIALPLLVWLVYARANNLDASVPALLFLLLVVWHIVILAHIFRHALSRGYGTGVLVALGYYWLVLVIIDQLVPIEAAA